MTEWEIMQERFMKNDDIIRFAHQRETMEDYLSRNNRFETTAGIS